MLFANSKIDGSKYRDANFVPLQSATFCAECELISANSTPHCLACGSRALLSLSRALGGSLRNQQTAHLITDHELDKLVRDLLRTVPDAELLSAASQSSRLPSTALRSQLRIANATHPASGFRAMLEPEDAELHTAELDLEPAIGAITERAQHLTGATGAAIALRRGDEIVCRARVGRTAPDLGVRLQTDVGISAEAVRTGRSCCATTPSAIRAWILPAAVAWESAPSSSLPCATTGALWAFSKYFRPPRALLTTATW